MNDSEVAKVQLREHLASVLVPPITGGFWSVQKTAQDLCDRNKQPGEVLRTFQNMLTKIPEWSESVLSDEVERILKVSKCTYLDDLLMGVFLAYMKSFASLQYRGPSSHIKVEFDRPNASKFIHELYKQSARKLWQAAYLFKTSVPSEQQSKNRKEVEDLVYKSIDDVIRVFLPWEVITKSYFVQPVEEPQKSVIFEDDSESEEEERLPVMNIAEEVDDKVSVTDLDEKEEQVIEVRSVAAHVPEPVGVPESVAEQEPEPEVKQITIDPLDEIDSNIGESLVLNV
jgi:hypothetical protein